MWDTEPGRGGTLQTPTPMHKGEGPAKGEEGNGGDGLISLFASLMLR